MPRVARVAAETVAATARRSGRPRTVANYASQTAVEEHKEVLDLGFESPLTDLESEGAVEPPPKRKRRRVKVAEPVVHDIPPVETKTSAFKGRLGYACLNTILRTTKPDPIFRSRTCRIDSIEKNGLDFAKNLGLQNVRDLCKLIQWNEDNKIQFMRLSSDMFPFASHAKYGYFLDYAATELKASGDLANGYGRRLTVHPGQFTQMEATRIMLSRPPSVSYSLNQVRADHCSMLQHMGMGKDSVMVIHMGGVYGNKAATLERFKDHYNTRLSDEIRQRLVLENDEMCYSADDLLPVCEELGIPLVFDYHHNWINPSVLPLGELITRINAIWGRKGIKPKQHLSSPRPGAVTVMEKRAHSDRCYELPQELPDDMDLMVEAKDKEQAVLHLYRIYRLEEVIHENLRPEKSQEVQKVGGKRKSYSLDPDNGEVLEDGSATSKKPIRKKGMKGTIEAVEPVDVTAREDVNVKVDKGRSLPERRNKASPPTAGEEPKPEVVSARRNRRKKESVTDVEGGEADVGKVARKRKKFEAEGDETELPQVQAKRTRKRSSRVDFSV